MKLLRWAVPLLVVAVLLAEVGGRIAVERIATQRLVDAGIAGSVEVTVGRAWWRPTILPTAFGSDLDRISVELRDAELYGLPVEEADYVLEGLDVAISVMNRTIGAEGLDRGTFRLVVDPREFGELAGIEVTVRDGQLFVGEHEVPADVRVEGDDLVVSGPALDDLGGEARIAVADPFLLPCAPTARLVDDAIELHCVGDRLPGVLASPLGPVGEVDPTVPAPVELEPPQTLVIEPSTTGG